jgi:hypothetical protein
MKQAMDQIAGEVCDDGEASRERAGFGESDVT